MNFNGVCYIKFIQDHITDLNLTCGFEVKITDKDVDDCVVDIWYDGVDDAEYLKIADNIYKDIMAGLDFRYELYDITQKVPETMSLGFFVDYNKIDSIKDLMSIFRELMIEHFGHEAVGEIRYTNENIDDCNDLKILELLRNGEPYNLIMNVKEI